MQKDLKCTQYDLPFNKKQGDLLGMLIGLAIAGIAVAVFTFVGCEVKRLTRRNRYYNYHAEESKKK